MIDPVFIYANYAEACLWAGLGIASLVKVRRAAGATLGLTLIVFGVSDVVEAHTGAWYDPWWLLAWKAGCVLIIATAGMIALRQHRASVRDRDV